MGKPGWKNGVIPDIIVVVGGTGKHENKHTSKMPESVLHDVPCDSGYAIWSWVSANAVVRILGLSVTKSVLFIYILV